MVCWRCGYEVVEGAANCQTCGADIGGKSGAPHDTQPIPAQDATVRMPVVASVPTPGGAAPPSTPPVAPPAGPSGGVATATARFPVPGARKRRGVSPLLMLFAAGIVMAVGSLAVWQFVRHGSAAPQATAEAPVPATAPAPPPDAAASAPAGAVAPPAADPATAAPPSPAVSAAAADTSTSGPGSGPALLAATRKERDAAIVQRDAALAEVKQLQSDLARVRASASSASAPVVPAAPPADAARLAQLQKDRDTLRFIVGSKKELMAQKVIESHLYLLPPPASGLTPISLAETTEIAIDGKTYGMNNVKDVIVIPSSVWENTDYKYTIKGSSVRFTILKPDAFRTFAKYFVLMLE